MPDPTAPAVKFAPAGSGWTRPTAGLACAAVLLALAACGSDPEPPRQPSAADNVTVLAPMTIAGLERERIVRLYLPPGYDESDRRYPVVYMHDGQNLFDDATSYVGEWGVDETLNALAAESGPEFIVVGVDHGGELRMQELSPFPNRVVDEAEGEAYVGFVVDQVKPFIDRQYRTLPQREHTAIFGSSMGGLISHYAVAAHPEVFSRAGVFSPSFPLDDEIFAFTERTPPPGDARIYMLAGGKEGRKVVDRMQRMQRQLVEQGHPSQHVRAKVVPAGEHNEALWRAEFREALLGLYEDPIQIAPESTSP